MVRIERPAVDVRPDDVAARLFALDKRVVVGFANRLDVIEIEEQLRIAAMLDLVVRDSGLRMMPVTLGNNALAALTGVEVAEEGLPADAMFAGPTRIFIEVPELDGFWTATGHTDYSKTTTRIADRWLAGCSNNRDRYDDVGGTPGCCCEGFTGAVGACRQAVLAS